MIDPSAAEPRPERRFAWIGTAVFAGAVAAGLARHEPWRDELQAWLVAERADSWSQLLANLRYEGNPALWHALLYGLAAFTRAPVAMQALHGVVACGFVFLFLRFAPFPLGLRALFPLGYFAVFEFALVSRGYGIGVLLAFGCCALVAGRTSPRRRPYAWLGALLLLLANTTPYGCLLAVGIGGALALEAVGCWQRGAPLPGRSAALAAGAGLAALGVALSIAQIAPEPDNTFTARRFFSFAWDAERFEIVARRLVGVFVPLPDAGPHFWETSWLEARLPDTAVVGVAAALLLLSLLALADSPPALACHAAVASGVLALSYYTVLFHFRYVGQVWIAWLVACWLAAAPAAGSRAPDGPLARAALRLREPLLAVLLVAQAVGGVAAFTRDWRLPFSASAEAARWIRERGLVDLPIVGVPDYVAAPLAAWLERDIFSVERGAFGSFTIWDSRRLASVGWPQIAAALDRVLVESGGDALLVVDRDPEGVSAGGAIALSRDVELLPLAAIPAGVVADERYFILRARRPGASESAPEASRSKTIQLP